MSEDSRTGAEPLTEHLAYAEASLMLIEVLMQMLLEKKVLTLEELHSVIDSAIETKQAFMEAGIHPEISNVAAGVLRRLGNSVAATPAAKTPG